MRDGTRDVRAGAETTTEFDLDRDAMLEGVVVDREGKPVAGFPLTFQTDDWDRASVWNDANDVTGADGRFRLGPMPRVVGELIEGETREGGTKFDFATVRVRDVLPGAAPVRVVVAPRPRIRGRVVSTPLPRGLLFRPTGAEVARDGTFEADVDPASASKQFSLRATASPPPAWR